ncbi:MAG: Gfo/Idh/MocA family oxidoreductase [Balneolaceae bacterium]
MKTIKWGVLSTAKIGRKHLIPALQNCTHGSVQAIASRNSERADDVAGEFNIPVSYGNYEELLADKTIDAVYNPLPNHLHVPWTIKAMEAGKHVLCEKPIALTVNEAEDFLKKTGEFPNLKVMEAFMYRFHPQWKKAKELVEQGEIGDLKSIHSFFSYFNNDPENIRNKPAAGGGSLMDIGCYCISLSRFIFNREPDRVYGEIDIDPDFNVDRKASGILSFGDLTSTFTCSTQMHPYQRVHIFGTEGIIEIEIPFNAPTDRPTTIYLSKKGSKKKIEFQTVDQYELQVDAFNEAILNNTDVPTPLADAINNMKVIDAMFKSNREKKPVSL